MHRAGDHYIYLLRFYLLRLLRLSADDAAEQPVSQVLVDFVCLLLGQRLRETGARQQLQQGENQHRTRPGTRPTLLRDQGQS